MSPAGQTFEIEKTVSFEAAHCLPGKGRSDAYGRVHGHSFTLTAVVRGTVERGDPWVEDLAVVTAALQSVAGALDHQMLNEIEGLDVPTLERIALWAAQRLKADLPGLARVIVARPSLSERCTLEL